MDLILYKAPADQTLYLDQSHQPVAVVGVPTKPMLTALLGDLVGGLVGLVVQAPHQAPQARGTLAAAVVVTTAVVVVVAVRVRQVRVPWALSQAAAGLAYNHQFQVPLPSTQAAAAVAKYQAPPPLAEMAAVAQA